MRVLVPLRASEIKLGITRELRAPRDILSKRVPQTFAPTVKFDINHFVI